MAIEIYPLPSAHKLLKMDVQYFHNDPKPGVTEHVIKVQYQRMHGKPQSFIIPLSADPKYINRKARRKLDAESAGTVAAITKELRKSGTQFFFGFRQVAKMFKTPKGSFVPQHEQDPSTICWGFVRDEHLEVNIDWAGEPLTIRVQPHADRKNNKQSFGIGYWNKDEYLKQRVQTLNDTATTTPTPTEGNTTTPAAAELPGTTGDLGLCSFDESSDSNGAVSSSSICNGTPPQLVEKPKRPKGPPSVHKRNPPPNRSIMVDQSNAWLDREAERVKGLAGSLGTSIRLRDVF
jgi:hypothetical protein